MWDSWELKLRAQAKPLAMFWQTALAVCIFFAGSALFCFTIRPHELAPHLVKPGHPKSLSFVPQFQIIPKLSRKMHVLLMGVDSNGRDADRFVGTRSDTMMLVSIDPLENKVGIISIPRDSRVHIPKHGVDKINSAHALGGPQLAMQTVTESFGVPIDHYVEVDTQGLKKLFHILGPVEVLVEKEMHYTDHSAKLHVDLKPGLQMLTPEQAEEYVRFRHDPKGDIGRIERQQWFIRQVAKKLKDPQMILKLPELVPLAYECVHTDLPLQDVLAVAAFAKDFPQEKVVTAMLPGTGQFISGGSYWVPDALASQAVFTRILGYAPVLQRTETPEQPAQIELPEDTAPPAAPGLRYDSGKPISIAIRYPKGCDKLAEMLSERLTEAGYRVKYKWYVPDAECRHDQLLSCSVRADENVTSEICSAIPEFKDFAMSLAIESHPASDIAIVLSPNCKLPSVYNQAPPAPQTQNASLNIGTVAAPLVLTDNY